MKNIVIVVRNGLVTAVCSDDGAYYVVVYYDAGGQPARLSHEQGTRRKDMPDYLVKVLTEHSVAGFGKERPFQAGDRVRLIQRGSRWANLGPKEGALGTLRSVEGRKPRDCGVEFDEPVEGGHELYDLFDKRSVAKGHGWYCAAEDLELVEETTPDADFRTEIKAWTRKMDVVLSNASTQSAVNGRALYELKSETVEWMQALEETVSEIRGVAVAAEAQSKAQALAFADFERRWTERVDTLVKAVAVQGLEMPRLTRLVQELADGLRERVDKLEDHYIRLNGAARDRVQDIQATMDQFVLDKERMNELETRITKLEGA